MIHVSVDEKNQVGSRLGVLAEQAPKAIARALNRAAENVRTNITRKSREAYYIKASDVKDTIRISPASGDMKQLRVLIQSRGTRRELINFRVTPGYPRPQSPPAALRVAVRKDGIKELPSAFVLRGSASSRLHVAKRAGIARYPVHILYGPSVPEMLGSTMNKRQYRVWVEEEARKIYVKRLEHEIDRVLGGDKR